MNAAPPAPTMKLSVKLFAFARETYGKDSITIDLPSGATVSELRQRLKAEIPAITPILGQILIAVNSEYVSDQTPLSDTDEVACIPPVSGG